MDADLAARVLGALKVKGLKSWTTADGGGYQADICFAGKILAVVMDHGWGGPLDICYANKYAQELVRRMVSAMPPEDLGPIGENGDTIFVDVTDEILFDRVVTAHRNRAAYEKYFFYRLASRPFDILRSPRSLCQNDASIFAAAMDRQHGPGAWDLLDASYQPLQRPPPIGPGPTPTPSGPIDLGADEDPQPRIAR